MKTKVINYRGGQHSRASVARRLQKVLISAGFLAVMLCFPVCKIATPAAFLDATPDNNELLKTLNVRAGGELYSGVITGTLPSGMTGLDLKFDDGEFKKCVVVGTRWKAFIPTGAQAAAGKSRWQVGSKHKLYVRGRDMNGNATTLNYASITFTRQLNKDANGDGYADVVVGTRLNDGGTGALNKGTAYIFYGSDAGVTSHPLTNSPYTCSGYPDCTEIQNPLHEANGSFGIAVGFSGDTNGDGYADLVVGASGNDGGAGASSKGAAYIFYGSASGITSHPLTSSNYNCSGYPDCTVIQNPIDQGGNFGNAVSFSGDTNGDGYDDVIVGGYRNDGGTGAGAKGAAYIFYGSASGVTSHPITNVAYTCSGSPDCTVIQNPIDESTGYFGYTVAFSGDTNGDDYADVIVGGYRNDGGTGALEKGAAYIFYGSASGITSHPITSSPYTCSGYPDCTVVQNPLHEANGSFGSSVSFAGDTNGDGYADVIIGARQNDGGTGAIDKGAAYIFYGSASGISSHPLTNSPYTCSGYPDCMVIQNPLDEPNGLFGDSVSFSGDTNSDGFADVIVGAKTNDGGMGAIDKGAAYIFYGSASGITPHPLTNSPYTCSGYPDCTVIQNPLHEAASPNGDFGNSVSFAGDTNVDGYADVIVGSRESNGTTGAAEKGSAYIFYGSASGITSHPLSSSPYTCAGYPDCTVIQNPLDEGNGQFGHSVGTLAPALRPVPASLDAPALPSPHVRRGWGWGQDALPARREDEIYA
jgi:ssDNA-binding Zn-finger/Zn-ribbon topoisomerase 1